MADVLVKEQATLANALADASAFRAWLSVQAPDAVVGKVSDALRCPVATWLRGVCARDDVAIGVIGPYVALFVGALPFGVEICAPEWVDAFVFCLSCRVLDGKPVVAAVALQVFDTLFGAVGF